MNKLPEINVSFNALYQILSGPIQSKLLLTGIELKVFNHLSEPRSSDDVAKAIETHPENTRLFLDGLAASNLVVKNKGLYQNTPVTQASLVQGSPTFIGEMFTLMSQMQDAPIADLPRLVKEGPPLPSKETDMSSEEVWVRYAASMANYQRAGTAQQAVEIVSGLSEFLSFGKMLDLGGGPGLIGIAIVAAHPTMKGVIFDKPSVVNVAETFVKEYEMEDRMEVMGGDFNHDSIGDGYDLIWASATLNFARHDLDRPIKKIYDALNPDGVFVSLSDGLTCERTKPENYVLSTLCLALMGQDMGIDQGIIADSMLRAGFKSVRSRTIDTPMVPMDLDIGRKK
jgi:SAM-dependent methyltransferase